ARWFVFAVIASCANSRMDGPTGGGAAGSERGGGTGGAGPTGTRDSGPGGAPGSAHDGATDRDSGSSGSAGSAMLWNCDGTCPADKPMHGTPCGSRFMDCGYPGAPPSFCGCFLGVWNCDGTC